MVAAAVVLVGGVDGHTGLVDKHGAAVVAGTIAGVDKFKSLVVALAIAVALGVEPCLALEGEFATTLAQQFLVGNGLFLRHSGALAHHVVVLHGGGVGSRCGCAHLGFDIGEVYVGKTHQIDIVGGVLIDAHIAIAVGTLAYYVLLDVGKHLVLVLENIAGVIAAHQIVGVSAAGTVQHRVIVATGHICPHTATVVLSVHLLERHCGAFAGAPGLVGDNARAAPSGVAGIAEGVTLHCALDSENGFGSIVGLDIEKCRIVYLGEGTGVFYHKKSVVGRFLVESVAVVAVILVGGHRYGEFGTERAGFAAVEAEGVAILRGKICHGIIKVFHGEAIYACLRVARQLEVAGSDGGGVVFNNGHVMPYFGKPVVAESAYGARLGGSLHDVVLGNGAAARLRDIVDYGVGKQNNVVKTFPAFVDVRIDGGVRTEVPLAFVAIGIVHVAVDHIHLPLEVHMEIAPCLGGV